MSQGTQVDYDALAKQFGAVGGNSSTSPAVDYDALAKEHGAISAPVAGPKQRTVNDALRERATNLQAEAQHQANLAGGPEGEAETQQAKDIAATGHPILGKALQLISYANRMKHGVESYVPETAAMVDKAIAALNDWKSAAAIGAGVFDPAIPAAYFMTQGAEGLKETVPKIVHGEATPENVQDALASASAVAGGPGGALAPRSGAAFRTAAEVAPKVIESVRSVPAAIVEAPGRAVGAGIRRLGGGSAGDVMSRTPTNAPAAGQLTNAEINQFAQSKGIDLLPGQATESRPVQAIQAVGERAITPAGEELARHKQSQSLALQNSFAETKNAVSPAPGMDANGKVFSDAAKSKAQSLKSQATAKYDQFREAAGEVPVDLSEASDNLIKRLDQYGLEKNEIPSALSKVYEPPSPEVGAGVPHEIDIARAQTLRSNALDIARTSPDGRIRSFARGVAEDLTGAIEKAADSVIAEAPEQSQASLSQLWKDANATYKQYAQAFTDRKSPLYNVLGQPDPAKSMQRFAGPGNVGGSVQNVRAAQAQGIDLSPVKRVVLENIEKKNFRVNQGGNAIAGYSPEFLKTLFTPEEFKNIQLHANVARKIGFEMNPSGTSNVQSAERQIGGILDRSVHALTAPIAARLSLSEGFKRGVMGEPAAAPQGSSVPPPAPPSQPPTATPPTAAPVATAPTPRPSPTLNEAARAARTGKVAVESPPIVDKQSVESKLPAAGVSNEQAIDSNRAPEVKAVPEPNRPGKEPASGTETTVRVPGEDREYSARYQVRELADVHPSHSGVNFQRNPKYALENDRDYSNAANQGKIVNWSSPAEFKPSYHITDNPDATNGPIVIDSEGHALGGNGRAMILQRVYKWNAEGSQVYKDLLAKKAAQFGIDPEQVKGMKQPVLVREINDSEFEQPQQKQTAITDFNKKGTAELTPSERAIADSRRVSQATFDDLASRFESGGKESTLADVLRGANAHEIVDRLIKDGVISPQERAGYVGKAGLSDAAKDRISNLLVGKFFRDPAQLDTVPVSVRNKLERIAAPLSKAEVSKEWSLDPHIQEALDILEEVKQRNAQTVDDILGQRGNVRR
jgi:hypothetical protein